jgi:DUF1680 family protein
MLALGACSGDPDLPAIAPGELANESLRAVPFTEVVVDDAFWAPRLNRNRDVTIPHIIEQNERTGRVANFERGAGQLDGPYEGRRFNDTDVYKIIEAASYAIDKEPDPALEAELDSLVDLIAAAQQDDGYLFPALTVDPENPALGVGTERWMHVSVGSHELYNAGHLIEAAVAHHLATGKRTLLDVAIAFADRIDEDFGPDARHDIPGHEEIELALVKLADVTGEDRYLELARFFVDQRGRPHDGALYPADTDFAIYNDAAYKQDHLPVVEQTKAAGHAVRATYLYTGMADLAARLDPPGYFEALESIWEDIVSTKLYLTGSIGARGTFESFGDDYELPNRGYGETCAAIGFEQWAHRMFLATGRMEYLDVMERTLYNGLLSGVSQTGDTFFYTNVLASEGEDERQPYFEVACCPANVARLLAQLPGFIYARRGDHIWVNHYAGSRARIELSSGSIEIVQHTDYPWDGKVRITVVTDRPIDFDLTLRIPGWALARPVPSQLYRLAATSGRESSENVYIAINEGLTEGITPHQDAFHISRTWHPGDIVHLELPMPVMLIESHPSIEDTAGKLAVQRGPIVYAFESIDNGGSLNGLALGRNAELEAEFDPGFLGGMSLVSGWATAYALPSSEPRRVIAVPYFAWANRGAGEMAVWVPAAE